MGKDIVRAGRWLGRNPLFAAAVTAILALGIGASTAVFSVVDAVLWRPIPYESSGRLVKIDETATKRMLNGVPAQDYLRWRDRNDVIEKSVPFLKDTVTVTGGGDPDQVIAVRSAGA